MPGIESISQMVGSARCADRTVRAGLALHPRRPYHSARTAFGKKLALCLNPIGICISRQAKSPASLRNEVSAHADFFVRWPGHCRSCNGGFCLARGFPCEASLLCPCRCTPRFHLLDVGLSRRGYFDSCRTLICGILCSFRHGLMD